MKKLLVVGVIVLFLGVSVIPSTGTTDVKQTDMPTFSGDTLYVGGNGTGNYSTIQDAIDDANNGDTVYVYTGFYDESLIIPVTITLQGEAPGSTIINAIRYKNVIEVTADDVNITGFTLTSPDKEWWLAGVISRANNTQISYNIIKNLGYGIYRPKGEKISIHHNILKENYWGIEFFDSKNNMVFNNSFENIYSDFGLFYSDNNTIFNNRLYGYCLEIEDSYNNKVYNNTINGKPIIYLENEKNMVIEYAGQVLLFNCENIIIKNCYFNESYFAVHLCATKHCKIIDNTFTDLSGCYLDYTWNTIIKGNIFNRSGVGGWQCINTIIKYNNFTNCNCSIGFVSGTLFTRILRNNFINNTRDIIVFFLSYFFIVRQNYWNEPRILPKIIHVGFEDINPNRILIDWRPAQEPYDIGV